MEKSKPVLFIAYQYPPQGGPGVHRSVRFVQYLRDFNYEPIVLTRDIKSIQNGFYPLDNTLEKTIPANIKVIRVKSKEHVQLRKFLMKFRLYGICWSLFYKWLWEPSLYWSKKAVHTAVDEIQKQNIKVIYTSSAPFSALLLGSKVKEKTNVKWVADLRDPWTDAFTWQWPSKKHWEKTVVLEKQLLNKADEIIVVTTEMKNLLLAKGIGTPETIHVIYNGYA